jgi:hypothetical protein
LKKNLGGAIFNGAEIAKAALKRRSPSGLGEVDQPLAGLW